MREKIYRSDEERFDAVDDTIDLYERLVTKLRRETFQLRREIYEKDMEKE